MDGNVREEMSDAHPGVLLITIDRPPVNAMSVDVYRQLSEVFEGIENRPEVRAVILTGAGDRAFIAGADTKALSQRTPEMARARLQGSRRTYRAVQECAVPVVAAINGPAMGAGFIIAAQCNILIAADTATFALPEINVGVLGGSVHIGRVLPRKVVEYMALTGERVDAAYLERFGVVHQVVARGDVLARAYQVADGLAAKSPVLMRLRKESLRLTAEMPLAEGYRVEQLYTTIGNASPDAKEAARASVERRAPRWQE